MLVSHPRNLTTAVVAATGLLFGLDLFGLAGCQAARRQLAPEPIVFVCEHGSVKSPIAAALFERSAAQRGLTLRAVARGVSPDERIPLKIATALRGEGFDVEEFRPQALSNGDLTGARRVVAIGVDLSMHRSITRVPIQSWNDVPAASVDYQSARAALQRHVDALLDELQAAPSR